MNSYLSDLEVKVALKRYERVYALRRQGYTLQKIGDQEGVSRQRILQILQRGRNIQPQGKRRDLHA